MYSVEELSCCDSCPGRHSFISTIWENMKAIGLNLETWSKACEDVVCSHAFLMNNLWQIYKHLKGTKLGNLLGDTWLRENDQYKEYYSTICLRESWGKLPALLNREGQLSGRRATARDLVKKRLKFFSEAVDNMYKKQSHWIILDKDLHEKTCQPKRVSHGSFKMRHLNEKFDNGVMNPYRNSPTVK
ncbi:unnamed protein product [Fraxinus pennsylvanica]|uniref:Exocyst subunit Exo70 family protein n=1 Tax=Fraxinus pennsylvanica TaxID=56036 RepID=A0AAD2E9B1_9LAMI|nr:unnamed protein product [Fraxinus pennsylvanica]